MREAWRTRRAPLAAVLSSLGLVVCAGAMSSSGAVAATAHAAAAGGSPAMFDRTTYKYTSSLSVAQEAARYQVMVLQASDGSMVPKLHAANPALKILMYDAPTFATVNALAATPVTCTDVQSDQTSHPSWFLLDKSGNRIQRNGYPSAYLMDVGNPAYQQACIAEAISVAKAAGFDGVWYDGFDAALSWQAPAGVVSALYPTTAAWQAALTSLINAAVPADHAQGLLAFGNIGGATATPGLWQRWAAPLDGAEEESWTDGKLGLAQQIHDWPAKLANAAWSEANGKYALLHSWNTTQAGNVYGLASMMLIAGGHASYSTSNGNYVSAETWYPEYTTAQQLGAPAGPYTRLSNGVYKRQFASGIVLVNPTASTIPSFSLGARYSGSGLTNVSSVGMGPTTGVILLRVGSAAPPVVQPPAPPPPPKKTRPKMRCVVPPVAHLKLGAAKRKISRAHCRVGKIVRRRSTKRDARHVLAQNPAPHTRLRLGAKVKLTIGR